MTAVASAHPCKFEASAARCTPRMANEDEKQSAINTAAQKPGLFLSCCGQPAQYIGRACKDWPIMDNDLRCCSIEQLHLITFRPSQVSHLSKNSAVPMSGVFVDYGISWEPSPDTGTKHPIPSQYTSSTTSTVPAFSVTVTTGLFCS
nr:hypothetical protein CFP56_22555 [Quercus suber]